jgi:hypothetical protein
VTRVASAQEPPQLNVAHAGAHGLTDEFDEPQLLRRCRTEPSVALAGGEPYLHERVSSRRIHSQVICRAEPTKI